MSFSTCAAILTALSGDCPESERQPVIDFQLEDIDGHQRQLAEFRGRPVLLAVANRESAEAAGQLGAALVQRLIGTDAVVVTVADVTGVPHLMRGMARAALRTGLQNAQRQAALTMPNLPPDAWDRFTLLLDWDGQALDALGLRGQTGRFHLLVLDRHGRELGRIVQDDAPVEDQLAAILQWVQAAG